MHDVAGETLESIDVAPRLFPTTEVSVQFVGRRGQRLQELLRRRAADGGVNSRACSSSTAAQAPPDILAPEHREGCRDGVHGPTQIPLAQQRDLLGYFRFQRIGIGRVVPGTNQRGQRLLKPREVAVVRRGNEGTDGEILRVLQDADRMQSTRGFAAVLYIS